MKLKCSNKVKLIYLISILFFVLSFSACKGDIDGIYLDKYALGQPAIVNLDLNSPVDDAASPGGNKFDIFVFKHNSGYLDKHEKITNPNVAADVHVTCTSGKRDIIIVVNVDKDLSKISTEKELLKTELNSFNGRSSNISENQQHSYFGKADIKGVDIKPGRNNSKIDIVLKRHVAHIMVTWSNKTNPLGVGTNIPIGIAEGNFKGDTVKINKVMLINVPDKCNLIINNKVPNDTKYYYGYEQKLPVLGDNWSTSYEKDTPTQQSGYLKGISFYTYPNTFEKDINGNHIPGSKPIKIVLIASYKENGSKNYYTTYYPITLNADGAKPVILPNIPPSKLKNNGVEANILYGVIANIKGPGVASFFAAPKNIKVKINVEPWTTKYTTSENGCNTLFKYEETITKSNLTHTVNFNDNFTGVIDWGDGDITNVKMGNSSDKKHIYKDAGTYHVTVYEKDLQESQTLLSCVGATSFSASDCKRIVAIDKDFFRASASTLTNLEAAFYECVNLKEIPEGLLASCSKLREMPYVFRGCTGLDEMPQHLLKDCVALTDIQASFSGCSNMKGHIPGDLFLNSPSIIKMGSLFSGCKSLTGDIPAGLFNNSLKVNDISYMFQGCSSLTGDVLNLLGNFRGRYINKAGLYDGCTKLVNK